MLFSHFVDLCSVVVRAWFSVFSIYVEMSALWSPSTISAHFTFCFTSRVVMLAFGHRQQLLIFVFCFNSCD